MNTEQGSNMAKDAAFTFYVRSITFSDGTSVPLNPGMTLIITGPNGGGKSTALADIDTLLAKGYPKGVVTNIEPEVQGTVGDAASWIAERFPHLTLSVAGGSFVARKPSDQTQMIVIDPSSTLESGEQLLSNWKNYLALRIGTSDRLMLASETDSVDLNQPGAGHFSIHLLQRDDALRARISNIVRSAFGVDLLINWVGGRRVWFHVGDASRLPAADRVTSEYMEALNRLPRLDSEGDGIRSFVGMLLASQVSRYPLLLIDEPEAFLHPPQARMLARILARDAEALQQQVIIATHSADVVQGVLGGSRRVAVCRVTRDGNRNVASVLATDDVTQLWSKPLLRSSSVLAGLFHRGVVACEGDADVRFYGALADKIDAGAAIASDVLFIQGGGKGSLSALITANRKLSVPVAAIADIGLLRNRSEFSSVVTALGGNTNDLDSDYAKVVEALQDQGSSMSASEFVRDARALVNGIERKGRIDSAERSGLKSLVVSVS